MSLLKTKMMLLYLFENENDASSALITFLNASRIFLLYQNFDFPISGTTQVLSSESHSRVGGCLHIQQAPGHANGNQHQSLNTPAMACPLAVPACQAWVGRAAALRQCSRSENGEFAVEARCQGAMVCDFLFSMSVFDWDSLDVFDIPQQ